MTALLSEGEWFRVDRADALDWLGGLPEAAADLVLTSPPYEGARLYLEDGRDLGIARTTEAWVSWLLEVCLLARRASKGLCALVAEGQTRDYRYSGGPLLLAADLCRRGFHLRKPLVYRRVGIPGSGGPDWLRNDWEPVLCFTRGGRLPWSDNVAMGHPPRWGPGGAMSHRRSDGSRVNQWGATGERSAGRVRRKDGTRPAPGSPSGRPFVKRGAARGSKDGDTLMEGVYVPPAVANPGNVAQQLYTAEEVAALLTEPGDVVDCRAGGGHLGDALAHESEAPFPERLCEWMVRSFCPPGGLVCDPFCGSGTAGAVAVRWGRRFLGCDLRFSQVELSRRRIAPALDLFHATDGETTENVAGLGG